MNQTLRSFYLFSFCVASLTNLYAQDSVSPNIPLILEEIKLMKNSLGENGMYEMPVYEFHLKEVLSRMMTHCPSSSSLLCECAKKLANGSLTLPLGNLLEIMPEVLKFAYESYEPTSASEKTHDRAPRPNAPPATANDAVVGKNVCDLTQVLALLSVIKKRIQILQDIVCKKFSETWTILEDIKEEIIDTRTILCDKFNGTFTTLQNIELDISGIFTVLEDLNISVTIGNLTVSILVDLSGVFTVLDEIQDDIFNTQTILCDKFNGTFTTLQEIEIDISGIFTAIDGLSFTVMVDLTGVFTSLENICEKIEGTFTVLDEIQNDIFDTQTILCDKFNGTFTTLQEIELDISGVFTVLEDLNISVTIGNLTVSVLVDLSGVFTVLEEIQDDIFDTQTILCNKFNGTFTTLEFICDKIDDISLTLTCFHDVPISTPTMINNPGSYCLVNDIVGTITILADCVTLNLNNFKMLGSEQHIEILSANDIVVKNGLIQDSGIGIRVDDSINVELLNLDFVDNVAGIFVTSSTCLKIEDCTFRGSTLRALAAIGIFEAVIANNLFKLNTSDIVINMTDAHNVVFKSLGVNNNTSTSGFTAFLIEESCNILFTDVLVNENSTTGVESGDVFCGMELRTVENVKLINCKIHKNISVLALDGISISDSSSDITIDNCEINQNVSTSNNATGISGNQVIKQVIRNTQANDNEAQRISCGYNLENCTDTIYHQCFALSNTSLSDEASGFRSNNSLKTIYEECIANDNIAFTDATGFELIDTDTSCILRCIAKRNTSTTATGRGIFLNDCVLCIVEGNIIAGNNGTTSSIGIEVSNTGGGGVLTTAVIGNKSNDQTDDYVTSPGDIPRIGLNMIDGTFTAPPTPFDNLFTQQSP